MPGDNHTSCHHRCHAPGAWRLGKPQTKQILTHHSNSIHSHGAAAFGNTRAANPRKQDRLESRTVSACHKVYVSVMQQNAGSTVRSFRASFTETSPATTPPRGAPASPIHRVSQRVELSPHSSRIQVISSHFQGPSPPSSPFQAEPQGRVGLAEVQSQTSRPPCPPLLTRGRSSGWLGWGHVPSTRARSDRGCEP